MQLGEYIQIIFKLFFFCLSELNPKQEKDNKENIEQFFYTLNNLMDILLEKDFKINYRFLSYISEFMNLIVKNFYLCGFIFEYESYDSSDDKAIDLLFHHLLMEFEKNYNEFLEIKNFEKLLNFSKVYKSNEMI